MDNTADLARILRVAGTVNWKDKAEPKPVTFEVDGPRYKLDEIEGRVADSVTTAVSVGFAGRDGFEGFDEALVTDDSDRPPTVAATKTTEPASCDGFDGFVTGLDVQNANGSSRISDRSAKEFPPAKIDLILRECPWMRHCVDDAATLPEPEWFRMLSTVGRCQDGQKLAHEFSRPYATYSPAETQRKVEHALTAAGPATCLYVMEKLNGRRFCSECPNAGLVTAPIVLGNPAQPVVVNNDTWSEPKPLAPTLPPVAPFDVNLLPGCFRDHVADISDLMQVPPDFPAAVLMVAFSGAVGRRVEIYPKQLDRSFRIVRRNLWGGIVGRPGFLKSPTIRRVLTPLRKLQAESLEAHKEAMQEYERALELWEMARRSGRRTPRRSTTANRFSRRRSRKNLHARGTCERCDNSEAPRDPG